MKKSHFFIHLLSLALFCLVGCVTADTAAPSAEPEYISGLIPDAAQDYVFSIDVPNEGPIGFHQLIDLTPYAGRGVKISGEIKAENVTEPVGPYGGIKFMVHVKGGETYDRWPCATDGVYGDFDWTPYEFTVVVPPNVDFGELILGLQRCSGKVSFRNIKAKAIDTFPKVWNYPEDYKCEYDERVTGDIRRRGVMSPHTRLLTEQDIIDMESWGVNLLRWQFQPYDPEIKKDIAKYRVFIDEEIACLDKMLPICDAHGIKVLIDMHCPPGGPYGQNVILATAGEKAIAKQDAFALYFRIFMEDEYLNEFIATWQKLAKHFKGNPAVWGYDLYNEPYQLMPVKNDYLKCQYLCAKAIREIDPDVPIIVESNSSCQVREYTYMQPLPFKNVIYQIHYYNPGEYTHQGVFGAMVSDRTYPNTYEGKYYDKNQIIKEFQIVKDFADKYGARIFCGEFSVICWAPNGEQYLEDVISLLEENNWDWTYHAFREWDGWSVEHTGTDRDHLTKATEDTPRKQVLLKYLSKNQK